MSPSQSSPEAAAPRVGTSSSSSLVSDTTTTASDNSSNKKDIFHPSNAALLLSLTSKKHRQRLLANGGAISTSNSPMFAQTSFAHRQLHKLGWTPDKGLGRSGTGRTEAVAVVKRRNEAGGLGHADNHRKSRVIAGGANSNNNPDEWWKDALGATLARLGTKGGSSDADAKGKEKKKEKKEKKRKRREENDNNKAAEGSSSSSPPLTVRHYTDEELFARAGGSRFGMRAAPKSRKLAKWRRTNDSILVGDAHVNVSKDGDGSKDGMTTPSISENDGAASALPPTSADVAKDDKTKQRRDETKSKKRKWRKDAEAEESAAAAAAAAAAVTESSSDGAAESRESKRKKRKTEKKAKADEERISKKSRKAKSRE